jgi:hypothetical protein
MLADFDSSGRIGKGRQMHHAQLCFDLTNALNSVDLETMI